MGHGADTGGTALRRGPVQRHLVRLSFDVRPQRAVATALAIATMLSLLSLLAHLPHGSTNLLRVLSADDERSLPTFWSCLQLVLVAGLAAQVSRHATADRRAWALTGAGVLLLAVDEAVSLHESTIEPLRQIIDPASAYPLLTFAWVVPGAAAVLVVGAVSLGFVRRMEHRLRRDLLVAVGLYLLGALVLEAVSGVFFRETSTSAAYVVVMTAEELSEMVAVALAGGALLRHLLRRQLAQQATVRFSGVPGTSATVEGTRRAADAAPST